MLHELWDLPNQTFLIQKGLRRLHQAAHWWIYEAYQSTNDRSKNAFGLVDEASTCLIEPPRGFRLHPAATASGWDCKRVGFTSTRVEHLVGPDSDGCWNQVTQLHSPPAPSTQLPPGQHLRRMASRVWDQAVRYIHGSSSHRQAAHRHTVGNHISAPAAPPARSPRRQSHLKGRKARHRGLRLKPPHAEASRRDIRRAPCAAAAAGQCGALLHQGQFMHRRCTAKHGRPSKLRAAEPWVAA